MCGGVFSIAKVRPVHDRHKTDVRTRAGSHLPDIGMTFQGGYFGSFTPPAPEIPIV